MELLKYRNQWLYLTILVSFFIFEATYLFYALVDHDIIWGQEIGKRMLLKGTYSQNFFENNPPLLFFWHAFSFKISSIFSLDRVLTWYGFVAVLSFISFFACLKLARQADVIKKHQINTIVIALTLAIFVVPLINYSQKSHLLLLLILPYFFAFLLRIKGKTLSKKWQVIIGISAALGFSLKPPYYFFAPILIEAFWLYRKKSFYAFFRPDVIAGIGVIVCYVAIIFIFYSDYVYEVFPIALASYAPLSLISFKGLFLSASTILFLVTSLLYFLLQKSVSDKPHNDEQDFLAILIFMLGALGFLLSFWLQKKGWPYQEIPCLSLLVLALGFNFDLYQRRFSQSLGESFFVAFAYFLLLAFLVGPMLTTRIKTRLSCASGSSCALFKMIDEVKQFSPDGQEFIFSEIILPSYMSYYGKLDWGSRFGSLWMMPYHIENEKRIKNDFTDKVLAMILDDFNKAKPSVVIVSNRKDKTFFDVGDNYFQLMLENKKFQSLWQAYHLQKVFYDVPDFDFKVYSRDS